MLSGKMDKEAKINVPRFVASEGFVASPQASRIMRRIRAEGSETEKKLRRALWNAGFRYRKNWKKLPGKPDLAFPRFKIALFIDGDFWHGRDWAVRRDDFKTNRAYWLPKIERNIQRDREVNAQLAALGWRVVRFWERELKQNFGAVFQSMLTMLTDSMGGQATFTDD